MQSSFWEKYEGSVRWLSVAQTIIVAARSSRMLCFIYFSIDSRVDSFLCCTLEIILPLPPNQCPGASLVSSAAQLIWISEQSNLLMMSLWEKLAMSQCKDVSCSIRSSLTAVLLTILHQEKNIETEHASSLNAMTFSNGEYNLLLVSHFQTSFTLWLWFHVIFSFVCLNV